MIAKKKLFGLPISIMVMAVVIAAALIAGNSAAPPPAEAHHRGSYDADCKSFHYKVTNIPSYLSTYVEKACFAKNGGTYDGVWLYLTDAGWSKMLSSLTFPGQVARWVVNHPYWQGTRSSYSVQSEIFYHALWGRSYTHPTHIEYHCYAWGWGSWELYLYGC